MAWLSVVVSGSEVQARELSEELALRGHGATVIAHEHGSWESRAL